MGWWLSLAPSFGEVDAFLGAARAPGKLDFYYWEPRFRPPKSQKIRRYAPKRAPFNFWGGGRGPRNVILFFLNEAF